MKHLMNMTARGDARPNSGLLARSEMTRRGSRLSGAVIPGVSGATVSSNCLTSARPGKFRRHPDLHGLGDEAAYYRSWNQKRRRENIAAGLTWDGRPRKRALRFDLAGLTRLERKVRTNRDRAEKFVAQGLTWSGGRRQRPFMRRGSYFRSPLEMEYRQLRDSLPPVLDIEFYERARSNAEYEPSCTRRQRGPLKKLARGGHTT